MAFDFSSVNLFIADTAYDEQLHFPPEALPLIDYFPYQDRMLRTRFSQSYPFRTELKKLDRLNAYLSSKRDFLCSHIGSDEAVIFLMPSLSHSADEAGKAAFDLLNTLIPKLATASNCYIYPYGSASTLMSIKRINALLGQPGVTHVNIVAVDCCDASLTNDYVANDCLLLTRVKKSDVGVDFCWYKTEAQLSSTAPNGAVSAIFNAYVQECGRALDEFNVTYTSEDRRNEWLNSYQQLSKVITPQTKTLFSNLSLGDIGTASGLFEILSFYMQGVSTPQADVGKRLQLDFSDQVYRSAALLAWQDR